MRLPDASRLPGLQDKFSQLEKATNIQTWEATADQDTFTLTNGSYAVGTKTLLVYIEGTLQPRETITELGPTSFKLSAPVNAGDLVTAVWLEGKLPVAFGHSTSHYKGGQDEMDVTKLGNYQTEVADKIGILSKVAVVANLKGDGIENAAEIVQNAINSLPSTGGKVYIPKPDVEHYFANAVILKDGVSIEGSGKGNCYIVTKGNYSAFISQGVIDPTKGIGEASISEVYINDHSTVFKDKYTIEFANAFNCSVRRITISAYDRTQAELAGVYFSRKSGYTGNCFVNKVIDCQLRGASVKIESTDSAVDLCEIWGHTRSFAIHIVKPSQHITRNQLVGSSVKGAVWVEDTLSNYDVEILKINDNYFDGSYDAIDSGIGLNAKKMRLSTVNGNTFWRQMDEGVKMTNCHSNTIASNTFSNNNRRDAAKDDIYMDSCAANNVSDNTHKRDVSHANKGVPIRTVNTPADGNNISGANVYFTTFYNESVLHVNDSSYGNRGIKNGNNFSSVVATFPSPPTITTGSQVRANFNNFTTDKLGEMTTGQFRAKKRGVYSISAALAWESQATGNRTLLLLYKNGTEIRRMYDGTTSVAWSTASGSTTVPLEANDVLEIYYYTAGNAAISIVSSYLTIERIY